MAAKAINFGHNGEFAGNCCSDSNLKFCRVNKLSRLIGDVQGIVVNLARSVNALETTVCGKSHKFAILTGVAKMGIAPLNCNSIVSREKIGCYPRENVNGSESRFTEVGATNS